MERLFHQTNFIISSINLPILKVSYLIFTIFQVSIQKIMNEDNKETQNYVIILYRSELNYLFGFIDFAYKFIN